MADDVGTLCQWLPPNAAEELGRPGMSDGDRAAWVARHGCRRKAEWNARRERTAPGRDGECDICCIPGATRDTGLCSHAKLYRTETTDRRRYARARCCDTHLSAFCAWPTTVVWPIDGAEPKTVDQQVEEALTPIEDHYQKRLAELQKQVDCQAKIIAALDRGGQKRNRVGVLMDRDITQRTQMLNGEVRDSSGSKIGAVSIAMPVVPADPDRLVFDLDRAINAMQTYADRRNAKTTKR